MKLLKFLNPKKDKKVYRGRSYNISPSAQTSGSDIVLKNIVNRKRGLKSSKVMFRKHHGLAKKVLVFLIILGIFSYFVYKFNILNYFKISDVYVEGASEFVSAEDIRLVVERNSIGQSIFLINTGNLVDIVQRSFLGAKTVKVEKEYPDKIIVVIEERVPLAIVYNDENEYFLIDSDGYVLGVVEKGFSDLPKIRYEEGIVIGTFLEKEIIPVSIEILKFAEEEELKISSMSFYPKYTRLFAGKGTEVFIGYDKDRKESLKTVNALIKKLESEGKTIRKIDLRYDKVIVLYD